MTKCLLEINHLSKNYHTLNGEIMAISDLSLKVNEEEFVAIVGSSGCGKSTLLNILANLDSCSSGEIKYHKNNLKIGYMLQEDALFPWLTILDNALLGLKIAHEDTSENIAYVKKLLTTYGLKDFINKYPHELSGGMKQRVG